MVSDGSGYGLKAPGDHLNNVDLLSIESLGVRFGKI